MKKLVFIIGCFLMINSFSQTKTKPKFTSINSFGLIAGSNQNVFTMQTINGFRFKKWVHGLGFAFDNYGSQSSPIFLHSEFSFDKKAQFFAYANAGLNVPWRTTNFPKQTNNNSPYYHLKLKPYGEVGLGIKRPINNNLSYRFFIGYSIKQFGYTEHNSWNWFSSVAPPGITNNSADFLFTYRRLSINMGFEF